MKTTVEKTGALSPGLSFWLDFLRVWATIVVVLSHWAYPRFTRGDYVILRELNLGSDAVIVFFVISGFVIAYAATRDRSLPTYAFNRITRLLSVLIPALLATYLFDRIGQNFGPEAYTTFYNPVDFKEMLLRGVSMSNEWGIFGHIRLGTNGPLWSLSYEAAYYVLFAIAFYFSGVRRALLLLGFAFLFGPRILLLMPAWIMGVVLWRWVAGGGALRIPLFWARALAVAGPTLYILCLSAEVPVFLSAYTAEIFAPQHYRVVLGFSDEFMWNALVGVFTALHIAGMARLLQKHAPKHQRIRWWAGASFSIYVTHYPALHLIDALFPAETLARDGLLFFGSIAVGLLFAQIFERPIGQIRRRLKETYYGFSGFTGRLPPPAGRPSDLPR